MNSELTIIADIEAALDEMARIKDLGPIEERQLLFALRKKNLLV